MNKLIAILGSSGSGKSALAHRVALEYDCEIFSLDALSIYKYIDIASAKPTPLEQSQVRYHAISLLEPHQRSNAMLFANLLAQAIAQLPPSKPLLIVGGSSFFLKSIIEGLSPMPPLESCKEWVDSLGSLSAQYMALQEIDEKYAKSLSPTDTYRIHKALALFKATAIPPSTYFATHKKIPFAHHIEIFVLEREREALRERIALRCGKMIESGIVEETRLVLESYGAQAPALQAIGTKECVAFLQGEIDSLEALKEQIYFHTCQLAKRQRTFNRTQFSQVTHLEEEVLEEVLARYLLQIP
ncbi:tRNA (adenosine(37)-N6)-dimethylallyltransferase MiaA [uncultured Helicobacter sp.]|uniref:tRNA (adenosine(37)-N6)-dimethylallyltransferase MiaA n=1 Tax=uncultured Helicobacter sp. TaxID=175537 RepID=UPI0026085397|nr:tRNA (adenosine(37)-N6)-dimethylallyltransferase MiaA [uncultured Helicobacter sp.]